MARKSGQAKEGARRNGRGAGSGLSRRAVVKSGAALAALGAAGAFGGLEALAARAATEPRGMDAPGSGEPSSPRPRHKKGRRVVVVGAGAFGGWSALFLLRRGARVTLLDAWGPGNSRASSGGETRIIRSIYGPDKIYVGMAQRSLELWRDNQERWGRRLYHRTGVLWMAGADDAFEKASLKALRAGHVAVDVWSAAEAAKRYPAINFEGVASVLYEKDAGYLLARRACQSLVEAFVLEGGEFREASAAPLGAIDGGELKEIGLSDGTTLAADEYLFAGGPWIGTLVPDALGARIAPSRQEVFFFGAPAGDQRFSEERLPVFIDHGERIYYGIPGNEYRGFKIGDDTHGPAVDPTSVDRVATSEGLQAARAYMEMRFPGMKGAPLLESRVCQYENSPDGRFILDRHPRAANVWIAGGGSGHGFKHGPAVGERMADMILDGKRPDPFFALARFAS